MNALTNQQRRELVMSAEAGEQALQIIDSQARDLANAIEATRLALIEAKDAKIEVLRLRDVLLQIQQDVKAIKTSFPIPKTIKVLFKEDI